jgi:hypothetical protein
MTQDKQKNELVDKLSTSNVPKEYHDVLIRARKWVFDPCGNSFMHPVACKIMVEMHDIITGIFTDIAALKSPDKLRDAVSRSDIIQTALRCGFSLSTLHDQDSKKLMPISDTETLVNFAHAILALSQPDSAMEVE